jgi:hypothetical protein
MLTAQTTASQLPMATAAIREICGCRMSENPSVTLTRGAMAQSTPSVPDHSRWWALNSSSRKRSKLKPVNGASITGAFPVADRATRTVIHGSHGANSNATALSIATHCKRRANTTARREALGLVVRRGSATSVAAAASSNGWGAAPLLGMAIPVSSGNNVSPFQSRLSVPLSPQY